MVERMRPKPEARITPKSLLADNNSALARKKLHDYREAKTSGETVLIYACSDARVAPETLVGSTSTSLLKAIAAASLPQPYEYVFNHRGNNQVIVLQHFDGTTLQEDVVPRGCGGLFAKRQSRDGSLSLGEEGIGRYVAEDIEGIDPVTQAVISASKVAELTNKPVVAAAVDHRTALMYPVGVFFDRGRRIKLSFPLRWLNDDPSLIYQNGEIPVLNEGELPKLSRGIFSENRRQSEELNKDSRFSESQKNQNPKAVIISASPVGVSIRYPETFGKPNTGFGVALPFRKDLNGDFEQILEGDLTVVLDQVEYAIQHATQAASEGGDFSSTHTLLIETPRLEASQEVAQRVHEKPWVQEWLTAHPQNRILIAEIASGKTQEVKIFTA